MQSLNFTDLFKYCNDFTKNYAMGSQKGLKRPLFYVILFWIDSNIYEGCHKSAWTNCNYFPIVFNTFDLNRYFLFRIMKTRNKKNNCVSCYGTVCYVMLSYVMRFQHNPLHKQKISKKKFEISKFQSLPFNCNDICS